MTINPTDNLRLKQFTDMTMKFFRKKSENQYYKRKSKIHPNLGIELKDGTILPVLHEGVVVLDNEFGPFVFGIAVKLLSLMQKNCSNRLFGFSERPVYEYITRWVFLFAHPDVSEAHKKRIKALLFAGHYKHLSTTAEFEEYIKQRGSYLKPKDKEALESMSFPEYFNYTWEVLKGVVKYYGDKPDAFFESMGYKNIMPHQHMRIHANPLSLNELVGKHDRSVRHRLLVAFYLRQMLEYFKNTDKDEYTRLSYYFEKFWKNHKIKFD